jgi:hypothetical protein
MTRLQRFAISGALALSTAFASIGVSASTSTLFTSTLYRCVAAGHHQHITIHTRPHAYVHIVVRYPSGSTANGGTAHGTGYANIFGTFVDDWQVSGSAKSGTARVNIAVRSGTLSATGVRYFRIYHPLRGEHCP